jgi:hypothetical protein
MNAFTHPSGADLLAGDPGAVAVGEGPPQGARGDGVHVRREPVPARGSHPDYLGEQVDHGSLVDDGRHGRHPSFISPIHQPG